MSRSCVAVCAGAAAGAAAEAAAHVGRTGRAAAAAASTSGGGARNPRPGRASQLPSSLFGAVMQHSSSGHPVGTPPLAGGSGWGSVKAMSFFCDVTSASKKHVHTYLTRHDEFCTFFH